MKALNMAFLKDVLICSLGAFGGPEAHYAVFQHQMVDRKKWLSEEELLEYMGLTAVLPGPSSTQTMVAIGYKVGGPILGFLTLLVWALPIVGVLTLFSVFLRNASFFDSIDGIIPSLGYIAMAFILYAGVKMSLKTFKTPLRISLSLIALILTYFFRMTWVFPVLLISGGLIHALLVKLPSTHENSPLTLKWIYLILFIVIAGITTVTLSSENILLYLFSQFYQFGYLVIGGGQVVIPYMIESLVNTNQLLSLSDFLAGFGLVQGLPGPMFSFASYAGGLAAISEPVLIQISASLLSALGLFLPGILLIYFAFPLFHQVKTIGFIQGALLGITSVATGLVLSTGLQLVLEMPFSLMSGLIIFITFVLLWIRKIPAPIIVILVSILGALIL